MNLEINAVLSPGEPLPEVDIWLVVDVLRATTTITTYFENGGRLLLPCATPDDARALRRELGEDWLLMGERNALPLDGFDVGNSPLTFKHDFVCEHPHAIMSTTNGTGALLKAMKSGRPVYAACARNAKACAQIALSSGDKVGILCAGRYGMTALDDSLCCGLLVDRLMRLNGAALLNDGATIAYSLWKRAAENFHATLCQAEHAKLLLELGLTQDVAFCAEPDQSGFAPALGLWGEHPAFIHNLETN
jgi:2-phosphosulfolactate phosphatase